MRYSCGGDLAFPVEALFGPVGAELAGTDAAAALREFLARSQIEIDGLPDAGWRQLVATPDVTLFGADNPADVGRYFAVSVQRSVDGWMVHGWGECMPTIDLGPGLGAATWVVDPAAAPPGPESRTVTAMVIERACASGRPPHGRIVQVFIDYWADAVVIAFGVRPLAGGQDCPGNPAGRVVVELREPLGNRQLLDGAFFPPRDAQDPAQR